MVDLADAAALDTERVAPADLHGRLSALQARAAMVSGAIEAALDDVYGEEA